MTEFSRPEIATLVKQKVFRYIVVPITGIFLVLLTFTVFSHLWILKNQIIHKAQIISAAINEGWINSDKILNIYASKIASSLVSIHGTVEENFLLTRHFHNILFLERNSYRLVHIIPYRNIEEIVVSIPLEQLSEAVSKGKRLIPPYYSDLSRTVVVGILNQASQDYILIGELDLRNFWRFAKSSVRGTEQFFISDSYGNYIAHPESQKVERQENITIYNWFPRTTDKQVFTLGLYEGSWFIIGGIYNNILGLWNFILVPINTVLSPIYYFISPLILSGLFFLIGLRSTIKRWVNNSLILPFELFSSYVREEKIENPSSAKIEGFFPFKEGEILEKSFDKAMSELRLKNKSLTESEEKFRLIADTAPVGIFLYQDDRLIFANREGVRITEYSEEELLNICPFWKLVKEEYQDIIAYNARRRQQGILKDQISYEFQIITKRGNEKDVRAIVSSSAFMGKPTGIITLIDVTEIKKAEEERRHLETQLQRAQRLESLGTLVAGISHEFNNILHAITLNIEHLGIRLRDLNDPSLMRYIDDISILQNRAATVVKGLINFSRVEGLEKKNILLHEEIDRVVRLCRQVFPRSIEFITNFEGCELSVLAGEGQMEQILINLLNNARDAIEQKDKPGFIEITTELTRKNDATDEANNESGPRVKITVRDNGIGIPPGVMERIFDPFFTTKPLGKGSGLGLSMVYGIVRQLEGEITCESRWGEGTTFTIVLPVLKIYDSEESPYSIKPRRKEEDIKIGLSPETRRILIIEDEITIRELMADYLRKEGYNVDTTSDPEEALSLLDSSSYDLILTDLGLPGIGGEGLLKELASKKINVPIIVASGYTHGWVAETLKTYGVTVLLTKPFSVTKLREAVVEALSRRKERGEIER